ncbi:MAG: methyltransferase domain-containing protein [Pseudomonadota bacterium]
MDDVVDRLETTQRRFDNALFVGADGFTTRLTAAADVGRIVHVDPEPARLAGAPAPLRVAAEEDAWPFARRFHLIVSILTLHGANDLVGALTQMRRSLVPDGFFVAALFGEETLSALRAALFAAESAAFGGASPRVAPFAAVRDLGGAMQRAGFALPVVDLDTVRVRYDNPLRLFADLRAMGETSFLASRGRPLTRAIIADAAARLAANPDGVRFDVIYLTGWAPAESQPQPLRPGSGKVSLADALRVDVDGSVGDGDGPDGGGGGDGTGKT